MFGEVARGQLFVASRTLITLQNSYKKLLGTSYNFIIRHDCLDRFGLFRRSFQVWLG